MYFIVLFGLGNYCCMFDILLILTYFLNQFVLGEFSLSFQSRISSLICTHFNFRFIIVVRWRLRFICLLLFSLSWHLNWLFLHQISSLGSKSNWMRVMFLSVWVRLLGLWNLFLFVSWLVFLFLLLLICLLCGVIFYNKVFGYQMTYLLHHQINLPFVLFYKMNLKLSKKSKLLVLATPFSVAYYQYYQNLRLKDK